MRLYIIHRENTTVSTYLDSQKVKALSIMFRLREGTDFWHTFSNTSSRGPCPPLTTRRPRASLMPPAPLSRHSPLLWPFVHLLSWRLHYWSNQPIVWVRTEIKSLKIISQHDEILTLLRCYNLNTSYVKLLVSNQLKCALTTSAMLLDTRGAQLSHIPHCVMHNRTKFHQITGA